MRPERRFVERIDAQAQVVDVASFHARRRPAPRAQFSRHVDEIDHGSARTQVRQAQVFSPALHMATQHLTVEADAACQVAHAQDKVVDALHVERGSIGSLLESCRCDDPCDAISTCNAPSQR